MICGIHNPTSADDPVGNAIEAIQTIQSLGSQVDLITWDEPLAGGHEYFHNPLRDKGDALSYGCQFAISDVQKMIAATVQGINSVNQNPYLRFFE